MASTHRLLLARMAVTLALRLAPCFHQEIKGKALPVSGMQRSFL